MLSLKCSTRFLCPITVYQRQFYHKKNISSQTVLKYQAIEECSEVVYPRTNLHLVKIFKECKQVSSIFIITECRNLLEKPSTWHTSSKTHTNTLGCNQLKRTNRSSIRMFIPTGQGPVFMEPDY